MTILLTNVDLLNVNVAGLFPRADTDRLSNIIGTVAGSLRYVPTI